jgi:salicylate hydroxylase
MSNKQQTEILVIGGGIGGLASARALALKGRTVHVIERAATFGEIGAGLQLAPNAMRSLDRLGVLGGVLDDAVFPRQLLMMNAVDGERITAVEIGQEFRARYGYPYAVMHRSDLHSHLLRVCASDPSITLETNRMVVEVADLGDSARVLCEDGTSYETSLLIGADGLHSRVRPMLGDDAPPVCQEYVAFRGTVPMERMTKAAGIDSMVGWVGPELHLIQYPVRRGNLFNQVAVFRSPSYRPGSTDWGTAASSTPSSRPCTRSSAWRWRPSTMTVDGRCMTGRLWKIGSAAGLSSWVTQRIRCCNIWPKAPAKRWRTPSAWQRCSIASIASRMGCTATKRPAGRIRLVSNSPLASSVRSRTPVGLPRCSVMPLSSGGIQRTTAISIGSTVTIR